MDNRIYMCQTYAFDIIGTTAFGESFQMIENGNHSVVTASNISCSLTVYVYLQYRQGKFI